MGALIALPNAATPVGRLLGRFDRIQLEGFIAIAIELLDLADGDPDVEPNGDELDGNLGEDDFHHQNAGWLGEPGCPVSDPGGDPLDDGEDDAGIVRPLYGVDQSLGPINREAAEVEHRAALLGLERSPTGGWHRRNG